MNRSSPKRRSRTAAAAPACRRSSLGVRLLSATTRLCVRLVAGIERLFGLPPGVRDSALQRFSQGPRDKRR